MSITSTPRAAGRAAMFAAAPETGSSRRNPVHRRAMAICQALGAAVVRGADAAELTAVLGRASGRQTMLVDADFRVRAHEGAGLPGGLDFWDPAEAVTGRLLGLASAERRAVRVPRSALVPGWLATPIVSDDTVLGYLLMVDESADDVGLIVAGCAAPLFAVTIARTRTGSELGRRYRADIVDSLVSGHFLDGPDAVRKARLLGVADSRPYRIAVARTIARGPGGADGLLARLADGLPFPAAVRGSELVVLLPERALPEEHLRDARLTCGVSGPTRSPDRAPQALPQAQQAVDLGLRLGRAGQTVDWEELGIYRLLLQIGDMDRLHQYAMEVLGPLVEYDASRKSALVGTLSAYLNQHESLKQTARVLRVHVNTVSYRIQRIESLTSLDLADSDDRLSAHVAVKIIESRPDDQRAGSRASCL